MMSRASGLLELLSWDLVIEVTPVNHDIPTGEQYSVSQMRAPLAACREPAGKL